MKKILFTLVLLLCCMTTVWAGTGVGSKTRPYQGVWKAYELCPKLKEGDYLAFDCTITNGSITVYDTKLKKNEAIVSTQFEWFVGDQIEDNSLEDYTEYCSLNVPEVRSRQMFKISKVTRYTNAMIDLTGCYTGKYSAEDTPIFDYVVFVDTISKIRVYDTEDLMDAIKDNYYKSDAVIQIMNDLDLSDYRQYSYVNGDGKLYGTDFNAELCGYHHRMNLHGEFIRDENGNKKKYSFELSHLKESLFDKCHNAKIRGIKITETKIASALSPKPYKICDRAWETEFTDVSVMGCRYDDEVFFKDLPLGLGTLYNVLVGNYAGHLASEMYKCTLNKVDVIGSTLFIRGQGVGNIVGFAQNTTFKDCLVDVTSTIYVENSGDAYVGGLAGICEDCSFSGCINLSNVCGSESADNVGGICGLSTKCDFQKCYNSGVLTQTTRESWALATVVYNYDILSSIQSLIEINAPLEEFRKTVIGLQIAADNFFNATSVELLAQNLKLLEIAQSAETYAALYGFFSAGMAISSLYTLTYDAIIAVNKPDEMGGISSAAYGCTFHQCMNSGRIFCRDKFAGGIVGFAGSKDGRETEIRYCINTGYVQGQESTGGIVGCLDESHAYYCLNVGTVDCAKEESSGPICGLSRVSVPANDCFAVRHGVPNFPDGIVNGNQLTSVSYLDVISGRVAWKLNELSHSENYCQNVGLQPYPTFFDGKPVTLSDVRTDIDDVFKVADYKDFTNAIFNQYADIELLDDIDFKGNFFSIYRDCTPFRGTIDGKGHSLKNISVDKEDAGSETSGLYALIGAADHATFKNLRLESCTFNFNQEAGGLVYTSHNSKYENVSLSDGTKMNPLLRSGGLLHTSDNDSLVNCGIGVGCTVTAKPMYKENGMAENQLYVGGLVWDAKGSKFIDCYNRGTVTGSFGPLGGIVAECENCEFTHCVNYEEGVVYCGKSPSYNGGIAAYAKNSSFFRCANYGKVTTKKNTAGAIVGKGEAVNINSCLNNGTLEFLDLDGGPEDWGFGTPKYGSIIGYATDHSLVVNCADLQGKYEMVGETKDMDQGSSNNYRLGDSTGDQHEKWEMWVSKKDFCNGKACFWLNNGKYDSKNAWHQTDTRLHLDSDGRPATVNDIVNEESSDVVKISNATELKAFADKVNSGDQFACAVLTDDILMPKGENWTPIGKNANDKHFRGFFNGQGHTISGMVVAMSSDELGAGLFGDLHANAVISNVIVDGSCQITNSMDGGAAGIVGKVKIGWPWGNVVIENCASYANVKVNKHGGGILGHVMTNDKYVPGINVKVNNCYSMGTITAENGNSGLLCGYTKNNGMVSNSWSGGQLRNGDNKGIWPYSIENPSKPTVAECLVGYDEKLDINNCYIVNPKDNVDRFDKEKDEHPLQAGVEIVSDASLTSGELCYKLNKGVTDGSQKWYQAVTGEKVDDNPVLTKLKDGTNMVFRYGVEDAFRYANSCCEDIRAAILGGTTLITTPFTDIDLSGDTSVADLLKFINAAMK